MNDVKIVAQQSESTVVAEFKSTKIKQKEYQSEYSLEQELIEKLQNQGYEYFIVGNEDRLLANLRIRLQQLNNYEFTNKEWKDFLDKYLINQKEGIVEKTRKVQEDYVYALKKEDGTTQNIKIIDKTNIHNNFLQVINQYEVVGSQKNRYDVTVLVNGLPLLHIELKRRGVSLKEAFNQIRRYSKESFWANSGLYEYVQIFVISNGTQTKYYSNTTREFADKENTNSNANKKKTSNSFEFTSFWADFKNKRIEDLIDFTETFLSRHTLLNILTKYCVFTSENILLVMRPYQIAATERILSMINIAHNDKKKIGTTDAGGYVWHTTGSGKTLTSFKTAQIARDLNYIDKVLFVVDRKDLDYQTMKEYDKFQKGAANSNRSTAVLKSQLESSDSKTKIIITTIQKLGRFIKTNPSHDVYDKHVVIVFDECHRSQFGELHKLITKKSFKHFYMFGFTGTPIFATNASGYTANPELMTTEQAFGTQLHTYTIVDAIHDENVLPFRIDYINTTKGKDDIDEGKQVHDIKREEALLDSERVSKIVTYTLEHFNQKTKRNDRAYNFSKLINIADVAKSQYKIPIDEIKQKTKLTGFNSIFACASIDAAKLYYAEFKKQIDLLPSDQKLKIGLIYSWSPNEDLKEFEQDEIYKDLNGDGLGEENNEDTNGLDIQSREFLGNAIKDYNKYFNTNYDTSADKFQNYYKDLSLRVKNREIDLLIVVNMFLTGFDATTLNTIWVDKRLKYHGLVQSFSRTNRILNSIKNFGNVICFRNLETNVNDALSLFGDKEAGGVVLLRPFDDYYNGYTDDRGKEVQGYKDLVNELLGKYSLNDDILGESAEKAFIKLYGQILRVRNILHAFDDFADKEILSERDFQDYQSKYIGLYEKYRKNKNADAESITDDIEFEIELVKSIEVNIDYILMLVAKYHQENCIDKEIGIKVSKAIDASPTLRNKKDLIMAFLGTINVDSEVYNDWKKYIEAKKAIEFKQIIDEENLIEDKAIEFINESFRIGEVKESGTDIANILPKMNMFGKKDGTSRAEKKRAVIQKLVDFFNRFFGL